MAEKDKCHCCGVPKVLLLGLGILIMGLVKYMGYSWEMALMVVGILAVLKGLLCMAMKK